MYCFGRQSSVEQVQAATHDLLYGIYDGRKDLIRYNFIRLTGQTVFQGSAPGDPQFSIDVDDVDSSCNRTYEILILCPRPAVKGEKDSSSPLNLGNSLDIQVLFGFPLDHAFQHAMHVAYRRSKDVDSSGVDKLSRFLGCAEVLEIVGNGFVDFRAGSDIAYFS